MGGCKLLRFTPLLFLAIILTIPSNNAQTTENLPHYDLLEEQSSGYYIGNVREDSQLSVIYDNETFAKLRFQFLIQPPIQVTLDSVSGVLSTRGRIDRDAICPEAQHCNITLDIAVQPVEYFRTFKVFLSVLDMNDNTPTFPQPSLSKTMSESARLGDTLVLPSAIDNDSPQFGVSRYTLGGPDEFAFHLHRVQRLDGVNEIKLVLRAVLDREIKDRYNLKIWAYDGGEPPRAGYIDVTLTVQDANDNPPVFENSTYYVSLREDQQVGQTFLRMRAHDPDVGLNGAVTYDLSVYSKELYGDVFEIDRRIGEMSLARSLDHEATQRYTLSVIATDRGTEPIETEATVVISVTDVNDFAPQIQVNTLTVSDTDRAQVTENADNQTFVAHVSVTDEDTGSNGLVTCHIVEMHFDLVELYSNEYMIVTHGVLDRENISLYDVLIICSDQGEPSLRSVKHVEVTVLDINDNTPQFTQELYNASITENNQIGVTLLRVQAIDPDADNNSLIEYSIPPSIEDRISINASSGVITAKRSFDRENDKRLVFNVMARDHGPIRRSGSTAVVIHILDQNDERPIFAESIVTFSIAENSHVGTTIGSIRAFDHDSAPFNETAYSLLPSNDSWMFSINPQSGYVTTLLTPDRETQGRFYLTATATDVNKRDLFSCLDIVVIIEDINDEVPMFLFPSEQNNTVYISSMAPVDFLVTKAQALDLDSGANARLTYTIDSGNEKGHFILHPSSGYLTIAKAFASIKYKEIDLELQVSDAGLEPNFNFRSLHIVVDSSIAYTAPSSGVALFSRTKLIIIITLSIASAILIIILLVAIIYLRRMEVNRKANLMIGLTKLTVNNNQSTPERIPTMQQGGSAGAKNGGHTITRASKLWDSPSQATLDVSEKVLAHWPASYPAAALRVKKEATDSGHEADLSADGSQTTNDSGRGPSDTGNDSNAQSGHHPGVGTTPNRVNHTSLPNYRSNQRVKRSLSPAFQTFAPLPQVSLKPEVDQGDEDGATSECGSRTDCQFKVVHARPLTVLAGPPPNSRPASPRKGAVVRYGDLPSCDSKRARAYYKDSPIFANHVHNGSDHRLDAIKLTNTESAQHSTFV